MSKEQTLELLISGIQKCSDNAEALLKEARLLLEHNHHSRAYFLAQIANEESAKVELLGISYLQVLLARDYNEGIIKAKFRSHAVKNNVNSYHISLTTEEEKALRFNDPVKLSEIIERQKADYSESRNTLKNDSMYVGWSKQFYAPEEKINEKLTADLISEVEEILSGRKRLPEILKRASGKRDIDGLNSLLASLEEMKSFMEHLPKPPKGISSISVD